MTEIWEYIQQANQAFWSKSVYHIWFYAAVLLIFLLEKCPIRKRVVGVYPLLFLISLYNPAAYYLIMTYTSGYSGYFVRLYSMIPLPVTLGLGTVLLIDLVCTKAGKRKAERVEPQSNSSRDHSESPVLRLILTGCFCGVMILGGSNVYEQSWLRPAQNIENVPEDAIGICRTLHQDEGVTIAVPDALSRYIRQIDASFYMPYGRYVNALGSELSRTNPEPEYVMAEAGREACDYIVVYNNEENLYSFQAYGWEPVSVKEDYLVYQVEGVRRTVNQYNSSRQLTTQTLLDEMNRPTRNRQGYHSVQYQYDQGGRIQGESYYDTEGNLIGQTGKGAGRQFDLIRFHDSSSGVIENKPGSVTFITDVPDNRFDIVQFQLFTANKRGYVLSFGMGSSKGTVVGEYDHQLPEGLYYLRMKANTNLHDEYIESLVFLKPGDKIVYEYVIEEITGDQITINELSVSFIQ